MHFLVHLNFTASANSKTQLTDNTVFEIYDGLIISRRTLCTLMDLS